MAKKVALAAVAGTALMVVENAPTVDQIPENPTTSTPLTPLVSASPIVVKAEEQKVLFTKITTLDLKGKVIGERIVDMYHFGTRKWLHDHMWWAMHNDHIVEAQQASVTDIDAYLLAQRQKLAEKFNGTTGN